MKNILKIFFSSKTTLILLIILSAAMGTATFVEDKFDTLTARQFVYEAKWFELLFLLLIINLIGHIHAYNLLSKKKFGGFIFHLAFIIMILGAGITRYFGMEGSMHIREGETSNIIYINEPHLLISYNDNLKNFDYSFPVNIGKLSEESIHVLIPTTSNGNIEINFKEYINNAKEVVDESFKDGEKIIELPFATEYGQETILLKYGETKEIGGINISFDSIDKLHAINILEIDGLLKLKSPTELIETNMMGKKNDTLLKDSLYDLKKGYIYSTKGIDFLFSNYYKKGVIKVISDKEQDQGIDAIILEIIINGKKYFANVFGGTKLNAVFQDFTFDKTTIKFAFGKRPVELPFSIHLNNFIIERYPGSESPSSFASEVTVIDKRNNLKEDHRIFMNNVLDYDKYRFFQSSYDMDEKGTILTVSHDFWGTWISYFGYFLLGVGFLITLFNKNSRFHALRRNIKEIRAKRKTLFLTLLFVLGCNSLVFSQNSIKNPVSATHADKFGHLLTQTIDGRFEPVHSLAYDVMHKIARKDKFNVEGKGKMDAMQVFIDMIANPEFWQMQDIIYIREASVKEIIGINKKKASYFDFFDTNLQYKLQKYVADALRKRPSEQNTFDKEIIKVDERVNIFYMVINGSILKIFPDTDSPNKKWVSWDEKPSLLALNEKNAKIKEDLQLKNLNYASILEAYFQELQNSVISGNYSKADKIIWYISNIQRQDPILLPSERKINAEIFYNKAQIFIFLKNLYAILSIIMLLLAFIDNIRTKKNKIILYTLNFCSGILVIAFLYHTLGLALRWYISGHAPWSNGYEALILIAWGALLAGFSFMKHSKITLSATVLLAFFVLMTASHSSYDPQLTNLQPVLKSYWLIIHVATLTISYAFLGLGFILGIMNMFIYLFKTKKNKDQLDLLVSELTYTNEINLIIGIVLATIGTFLGAIWANESWGRYWGWDAKETWALIIILTYTLVLHLRFIPKLKGKFIFNVASIIGFGSVIMTFVGVNYYLSKGLHTYGQKETPVFPIWAWIIIISILILILTSGIKAISMKKIAGDKKNQ